MTRTLPQRNHRIAEKGNRRVKPPCQRREHGLVSCRGALGKTMQRFKKDQSIAIERSGKTTAQEGSQIRQADTGRNVLGFGGVVREQKKGQRHAGSGGSPLEPTSTRQKRELARLDSRKKREGAEPRAAGAADHPVACMKPG